MSNKDDAYKGSTFWQLIIAIPGSILAFTLLISLIAKTSSTVGVPEAVEPEAVVALAVEKNIEPVATVEVAVADAGPKADKSGEEVYKSVCMMCHDTGLMAAPKFGDKDAWKPRIAQGYETLVSHAINGIRTMPAKGGNAALTDGEIYNAVAHMANAAGADFKAPAPKAAAAVAPAAAAAAAPVAAAPVAVVADASATGKSGEEVYKSVCMMCHDTGLMAAPKFGDKAQWAPRIAQGYDTLVTHAVKGVRNMPAKGGNPGLSDAEVAGAVKYMADAAGAKF